MPVFAFLGPLLSQVLRWFALSMAVKGVVKVLAFFGIAFATDKLLIAPLLSHISGSWTGIAGDLAVWLGALGIDKMVSILLSAYSIEGFSRVFLAKS